MKIIVKQNDKELIGEYSSMESARMFMNKRIDELKGRDYHKQLRMVQIDERKVGHLYQDLFGFYENTDRELKNLLFMFSFTYDTIT